MERVGIRQLRQYLSIYVRRVAVMGETLEVTDRGHPVARLTPLPDRADPIARLEANGKIARRAKGTVEELGPPLRVPLERPLSETLDELREDRI